MSQQEAPIICLASWYPNDLDAFEGDFIQRKMLALSLFRNVEVFHIKKHQEKSFEKKEDIVTDKKLKVNIQYLQSAGKGISSSIKNYFKFFKLHRVFLEEYIAKHGKPKLILVQVPYNAGIMAWYWKRKYNIPYIVTEHYGIYNKRLAQHFNTRSWLYKYLVKGIVKKAEKLITVSNSLGQDMNNWVVKKEFEKISNVVDTEHFCYKEKHNTTPFVFCHLSNMIPLKNIPGMIEAVHLLSQQRQDFIFNLIGQNNSEHKTQATKLGLIDKFIFFNTVIPYENVASTLQASHALIMFSNTESQSCISLEALCTGTPVISSKAGGIEEHLNNGNSIVVEREDSHALAQAMNQLINNYSNYNLKEIALENQHLWNYRTIGAQYNELIEDVLSQ